MPLPKFNWTMLKNFAFHSRIARLLFPQIMASNRESKLEYSSPLTFDSITADYVVLNSTTGSFAWLPPNWQPPFVLRLKEICQALNPAMRTQLVQQRLLLRPPAADSLSEQSPLAEAHLRWTEAYSAGSYTDSYYHLSQYNNPKRNNKISKDHSRWMADDVYEFGCSLISPKIIQYLSDTLRPQGPPK